MVVILYMDIGFQGSSPTYEQAHVGLRPLDSGIMYEINDI